MEPIYQQDFIIGGNVVDRFDRLKPAMVLYYVQEVAGNHFNIIGSDYDTLEKQGMLWAIIRQRVQITRLPRKGETIHVETWPMPNTRVAFPRSVVAYDQAGNEVFRSISIWVLMDKNTRNMILPAKSGLALPGTLRGNELSAPNGLPARELTSHRSRIVCFSDLDRNGHMNNTRYLDWIADLLPSSFHENHTPKEIIVCYLSEAWEGQELNLSWGFLEDGCMQVDAHRLSSEKNERVFSARLIY